MQKPKPIDGTAGRVGVAMQHVRWVIHLSPDEAARLLRVMPNDILEYERGISPIPPDVMEYIFTMAYKMMRFRYLEDKYRFQRRFFRKLKQTVSEIP